MWFYFVAFMSLAGAVSAQSVPISSEEVAPLAPKGATAVVLTSPSTSLGTPIDTLLAATPTTVTPVAVSPTFIESYFVPGLNIELPPAGVSSTLREMALVQAARAGLSRVLGNTEPPLDIATQTRLVAEANDPMGLVKSYRIAEEVLTPSYTLTVDMTYRPEAVMGLLPKPGTVVSGTENVSGTVPAGPALVVRVSGNAASQDKVLKILKAEGLAAVYSRLTVDGAELGVPPGAGGLTPEALAGQLRAKGLAVDASADGGVDVRF